jgi:hypothetical protein
VCSRELRRVVESCGFRVLSLNWQLKLLHIERHREQLALTICLMQYSIGEGHIRGKTSLLALADPNTVHAGPNLLRWSGAKEGRAVPVQQETVGFFSLNFYNLHQKTLFLEIVYEFIQDL